MINRDTGIAKPKLIVIVVVLIAVGIGAFVAMGGGDGGGPSDNDEGETEEVVFLMAGPKKDAFSAVMQNGAEAAENYYGLDLTVKWENWDMTALTNQFQAEIENSPKPEGIVIMGHPGLENLESLVDQAISDNITVTTANVPLPELENEYSRWEGFGYAGENLYETGQALAEEAVSRAGLGSGNKALLLGLKSIPGRGKRSEGAEDALLEEGLTVDYHEISDAVISDPSGNGASFVQGYLENNNYDLVISEYGQLVEEVPSAVSAVGYDPYVAGFDLTSGMVLSIRNEEIDLVLDQFPYLQGFFSVLQVKLHKKTLSTGLEVPTKFKFVDDGNIDAKPHGCKKTLATLIDEGVRGMSESHDIPEFGKTTAYFFPGGPAGGIFSTKVQSGATAAKKRFGVNLFTRWSDWSPAHMVSQFQDAIAQSPDGISVTGIPGVGGFGDPIAEAEKKEIIVTSHNVSLENLEEKYSGNGFGYIGQDLWESGYKLAKAAVEDAGLESGDRVFLWGLKSWPGRSRRTFGAENALVEAGLKTDYQEITPSVNSDPAAGLSTATGYLLSHPNCDMIITDHGGLTATLSTYLRGSNIGKNEVYGAGFDLTTTTVNIIETGWADKVLDQQPWLQGYLPILQICLSETGGFPGLHINTGADIIDQSNVDRIKPYVLKGVR